MDEAGGRPRLALGLPVGTTLYKADQQHRIVEIARAADAAGIDTLVHSDHVVMGGRTDRYPFGTFAFPDGSPWLEPLTTLAVIAGATSRVRLSTGILIAGLRRAPLLAKTAATLDALSGGRLELGVGTGWQREEYEAMGLEFGERAQILDDTVTACKALWAEGGPASVDLPTLSFDGLWCDPKPVAPGGPAILFSGPLTARNLRRITGLGDGWIPIMGEPVAGVAEGVARIRRAWAEAGRGGAVPRVRHTLPVARTDGSPDLDRTLDHTAALSDAGVTEATVPLTAFTADPDRAPAWVDALGARWHRLWT
ncbi:putative F420-dependent oxidoreductase [Actinocorallia herbida]|uniref:Putative F420-dependent oxidoreductase n=1 Tax=Actinocorallia herbida TaxID=58109 RepID=A0A3N1CVI6_9ACTN|nr:TIGR03619 family F420-dependent LLM class oxidoreductase [Actinocorallia herbida]ROO85313.1 putative F420-dependent oxidoreductase [Actinocorallia herbida]